MWLLFFPCLAKILTQTTNGVFVGEWEWEWLVGLINKVSYYIGETQKITLMSDGDFPSGRPRPDMVL